MFESLLPRTQINARNIARGAPGEELPDQNNILDPAWRELCTRYKFRSIGWKNISVSRFLAEFLTRVDGVCYWYHEGEQGVVG